MKIKKKTAYNIVFYAFVAFDIFCIAYTVGDIISSIFK